MFQSAYRLNRVATVSMIAVGAAVAFSSFGIVRAEQAKPAKKITYTCNTVGACVLGTNSGTGIGVEGVSLNTSVPLAANNGGLLGEGTGYNGVYGYSTKRNGGYFENNSNSYVTLFAWADSNSDPLEAANSAGAFFYVDNSGNGNFSGAVYATGFVTDLRTRDGNHIGSFNVQSTGATIEDTGTARMMNGEGVVRFDATFARTVDLHRGYQVFLTADGETRGWLYIAEKYEGGFVVREAEHGRSSIYFDYRVVAHPVGSTTARLPQLNIKQVTRTGGAPITQ